LIDALHRNNYVFAVLAGAPSNALEYWSWAALIRYRIGTHLYSLLDIEHGILLANRALPGRDTTQYFEASSTQDPRCKLALSKRDERMHFLLNIGVFTNDITQAPLLSQAFAGAASGTCDALLGQATQCFIDSDLQWIESHQHVAVCSMFEWYLQDFVGGAASLNDLVRNYLLPQCTNDSVMQGIGSTSSAKSMEIKLKYYQRPRIGVLYAW
jgi:hypothetical protein